MHKDEKKRLEKLLKKAWKSMHEANKQMIKGCKAQNLDILIDLYELADKLVTIYEQASLTQLEEA